jgi:1-acyl-sn-glycerol-3-phosphate acyltransferase
MLNRVDRRSQLECLKTCIELLHAGACVLFFPEGTRSKDQVMAGFKKGAFSVACKAGAPVVPVTLVGTGGRQGQVRCSTTAMPQCVIKSSMEPLLCDLKWTP